MQTQVLKMQFQKMLVSALNYIVKRVLLYDLILLALALFSFLLTGRFSFVALSERIFWFAVVVFLIAGTVALAQMVPGKIFMFPYNIRKPDEAKKFMEEGVTNREQAEKRFDAGIQLWLIGLVCLAVSALVQILLT